jgi:hypothetical protein
MPGYVLISQSEFSPPRARGITRYAESLGLLDFLRELEHEQVPFSRNACIRVEGLEEVLYAVRPDYHRMAIQIRNLLNKAANELSKKLITVQVVLKGRLQRGATLRSLYRNEELPIHIIFGTPTSSEVDSSTVYRVPFSLTSP